jgi:hypothetical protein
MDLWNVGILPQHYTASQPRRPPLEAYLNFYNVESELKFETVIEMQDSGTSVLVQIILVY